MLKIGESCDAALDAESTEAAAVFDEEASGRFDVVT